jgi:hypothetical protein
MGRQCRRGGWKYSSYSPWYSSSIQSSDLSTIFCRSLFNFSRGMGCVTEEGQFLGSLLSTLSSFDIFTMLMRGTGLYDILEEVTKCGKEQRATSSSPDGKDRRLIELGSAGTSHSEVALASFRYPTHSPFLSRPLVVVSCMRPVLALISSWMGISLEDILHPSMSGHVHELLPRTDTPPGVSTVLQHPHFVTGRAHHFA